VAKNAGTFKSRELIKEIYLEYIFNPKPFGEH
jgi:hypothetical protein